MSIDRTQNATIKDITVTTNNPVVLEYDDKSTSIFNAYDFALVLSSPGQGAINDESTSVDCNADSGVSIGNVVYPASLVVVKDNRELPVDEIHRIFVKGFSNIIRKAIDKETELSRDIDKEIF